MKIHIKDNRKNTVKQPKIIDSYKWISVDEKLPEKNTYVLMAATSGFVTSTFYTEPKERKIDCKISAWFEHANKYHYEVSHWMPLPKAPSKTEVVKWI